MTNQPPTHSPDVEQPANDTAAHLEEKEQAFLEAKANLKAAVDATESAQKERLKATEAEANSRQLLQTAHREREEARVKHKRSQ